MLTRARNVVLPVAFVALLGVGGPPAAQAQGTFCQPVNAPWALPNSTIAYGINNRGDVVGWYLIPWVGNDEGVINQGFLLKDGVYAIVQIGPTNTEVYGINDRGQMVGEAGGRAFIITDAVPSFLDLGGGPHTATAAIDINNNGDIAGIRRDAPDFRDKGFVRKADGSLYTIVYPGIAHTEVFGINDDGIVVGSAADGFRSAAFWWNLTGPNPVSEVPGGYGTSLTAINNARLMVGTAALPDPPYGGSFTRPFGPRGRFTRFVCPESDSVFVSGINDHGAVVGNYGDAGGQGNHSFYTPSIRLIDPVPDLVRSSRDVTGVPATLATAGRDVQAIAADGVSQILVRIPIADAASAVTVKVYQDETTPSTDTKKYGAVGRPGDRCPGNGCTQSEIIVPSQSAAGAAWAFVVYRAPEDFPRDNGDASLKYRDVFLRIESSSVTATLPVRVVRPPVAAVHGIWDDDGLWKTFQPLVWGTGNSDPRFAIFRINYGQNVSGLIQETFPHYAESIRVKTTGSALGFEYNAGVVQKRIREELQVFKTGRNPANMSVAAVQVDVVAHSMGGDVTRTMPLLPDFLQGNTYGEGIVHKLITVDTPHKGAVLATALVSQMSHGHFSVPLFLGNWSTNVVLRSATLRDGRTVSGAVGDLVHNTPSAALQRMDAQRVRQIPTAFVAGAYTNWANLTGNIVTNFVKSQCQGDALAAQLTANGWPALFGEESDATVGMSSQDPFSRGRHFPGYVHSSGMVKLGFAPPTIISNGEVATQVISLLNTPMSDTQTYMKLPQ
jgi:hypothetical protein